MSAVQRAQEWALEAARQKKRAEAAEARNRALVEALENTARTLHERYHLAVSMEDCRTPRCESIRAVLKETESPHPDESGQGA